MVLTSLLFSSRLFSSLEFKEMQAVSGILLMFVGAAVGLLVQDPVVCSFTESNQCYVALGRRLHLQIPLKDEDGFDLKMKISINNDQLILKYRKTYSNPPKPNPPRWQFVIDNKTMILTSAERSDSGTYTLDIFDANGNHKGPYSLQLNIEGLVDVTLAVLSTVCVLLIVLSVSAFYIYKKKQGLKNKEAPAQDDKELVYAQVTAVPTNNTNMRPGACPDPAHVEITEYATVATSPSQSNRKKKEDEVQYGELVFSTPASEKSVMPKAQEECVYSQVQHGQ